MDEHQHLNEQTDATVKAPVDCYEKHGPKFADCETESGWDCCFIGTAEDLDAPIDPVPDPVDCYKTFGPNFADCQREWGWDCCYVDDDAIQTNIDPLKDYDKPVSTPVVSDDQCTLNFGVRWYDCQRGYGLDCCLIDDVDQKDPTLWDHDWTVAESESESATSPTNNDVDIEDDCAQAWGPKYCDCGRGFGLDCCLVDDGTLPTHEGEMKKHQMEMNKNGASNSHVLRWLVLLAMMSFVVTKLVGRKNSNRRSFPRSGGKKFSAIPKDDDEFDGDGDSDSDSDIELKPLI
jgi:hypothetical protein